MSRSIFTIVIAFCLLVSGGIGVVAADSDILSPTIENNQGVRGLENPDDVVKYGSNATPSWIVSIDDGEKSSLETWADSSEDREVREWINSNEALVVAPSDNIVSETFFDSGFDLQDADYVKSISYNVSANLVEPADLSENESPSRTVDIIASGEFGSGQASDVETTTMKTVRQNIGDDQVSSEGSGITIGIVDTGLNTGSSSGIYQSRVVAAKNTISGNTGIDAVADGNGHGSWVASAAAGNSSTDKYDGVATSADLVIAKSLSDSGKAESADIIEGLQYTCERSDIVNMSLGTTVYSEAINTAVQDCIENHNTVVVIAAGNSGQVPELMLINSPANSNEEGAITVGASSNATADEARIASFSSVGPARGLRSGGEVTGETVDVAAPGMAIKTQVAEEDGTLTTSTLSGTSMASPVVSGSLAVAMASDGNLQGSPSDVRNRIENTSARMPHAAENETQYGMVNVDQMVNNTEVSQTQEEAMDSKAQARDQFYRSYSGSRIIEIIKNGIELF